MVYRSRWYDELTSVIEDCSDFVGSVFSFFMYVAIGVLVLWGIVRTNSLDVNNS